VLGSLSEADDALQEAWLRASRAELDGVDNLGGWLTTIVARVSLNLLRTRDRRREEAMGVHLPDPVVRVEGSIGPEDEIILADEVGLALMIVLDTLPPAERLAFVLHDSFGVPYVEIAPVVERSAVATRQLASRARRRVAAADVTGPDVDLARQREVVDAFFRAAREGDFEALLRILHPDVVLRTDIGANRFATVYRGAAAVAGQARGFPGAIVIPAVVNGSAGVVITARGRPLAIMGFTIVAGRVVEIVAIADPDRVARVAPSLIAGQSQPTPESPIHTR
jgi:RNA polymerase sigma factor (sigma-70 family)